jgi:nitroimidazol reductase NimA-like FMN-containing flavoprotein (pyridoxamine 5'-phosphate oxidase superfamily)
MIASVEIDRAGLQVLSSDEAVALLASVQVGRIGISSRALPLVLPVHYALDRNRIVIRTHAGSTLSDATRDVVVAFEAEGPLEHSSPSWSVHVNGVATHVADEQRLDDAALECLPAWSLDQPSHVVTISIDRVSGRRLVP